MLRNFSDKEELQDVLATMTYERLELFSDEKVFEKFLFRKLIEKTPEELKCLAAEREQYEFRLPAIESTIMRAYVLTLFQKTLVMKSVYEMPSVEVVRHKFDDVVLDYTESDCKYIDKLFRYKSSLRGVANNGGWLKIYQKYVNLLKTYGGVVFANVKEVKLGGKSVRVYYM